MTLAYYKEVVKQLDKDALSQIASYLRIIVEQRPTDADVDTAVSFAQCAETLESICNELEQ